MRINQTLPSAISASPTIGASASSLTPTPMYTNAFFTPAKAAGVVGGVNGLKNIWG